MLTAIIKGNHQLFQSITRKKCLNNWYNVYITPRELDEVVASREGLPTKLNHTLLTVYFNNNTLRHPPVHWEVEVISPLTLTLEMYASVSKFYDSWMHSHKTRELGLPVVSGTDNLNAVPL